MDPQVVAAVVAGALTVTGTLAAQYLGRRATNRDTENTLEEQRKHLDRTLAGQREQLDKTLAEQRTRTLNERFATAADQLGSDKPAPRLAGVYAMAGLADDWEENRQTCVEVLCAYLRMPYEADPGQDAPEPQRLAFQAIREVRHTVIRVIAAHLAENAAVSWQGLGFDFRGVVFDGGDFSGAQFSSGSVDFRSARFSGGEVRFSYTRFSGGWVNFSDAQFCGGRVDFMSASFSGGTVDFYGAQFSDGEVSFGLAQFSSGSIYFHRARFSGGTADFRFAEFRGGLVNFCSEFSGGTADFRHTKFCGGTADFRFAEFRGGTVDFRDAIDWSFPPLFSWTDTPPPDVKLPQDFPDSQADSAVSLLPPAGPPLKDGPGSARADTISLGLR